ncbi:MAG: ABC transporter substrate-binding protein [Chloroflexota bacterium]
MFAPSPSPTAAAIRGGTIYLLNQSEQWNQVDPQRIYTGEDFAFFGATTMRSLTTYEPSPDLTQGTTLAPDLATDLGTSANGGRTWTFTLRPGGTWQDGAEITCEDVKYGVSRSFATDIINQGPTYAITSLDIATEPDGSSSYKGPYTNIGQDLYDQAVTCAGRTITFHLKRPSADFNDTVTLGFAPVRRSDDTGETFGMTPDSLIPSTGPYKIDSYTTGVGGRMILSRNEHWNPASDPIRKAYPDRWEVEFGVDLSVIDQRITESAGRDAFAVGYDSMTPERVRTVFADPETPLAPFASRTVPGFDPYVRYYWINVNKVPNVKVRQAMMVALDRAAIRDILGGDFFGTFADGVLKPNIGLDYAPTGLWTTSFGQPVPDSGDPVLARKLIQDSGEVVPTLTFTTPDTPVNKKIVAVVIASLAAAGVSVEYMPPCYGYCSIVFAQDRAAFGSGGWGADWPSASTVIPALFSDAGGWDLSNVADPAFNAAIRDVEATADRAERAQKWQALNRRAVENGWVIPTFFSRSYRMAGTNVGPIYQWPAYQSWPYAEMYITP